MLLNLLLIFHLLCETCGGQKAHFGLDGQGNGLIEIPRKFWQGQNYASLKIHLSKEVMQNWTSQNLHQGGEAKSSLALSGGLSGLQPATRGLLNERKNDVNFLRPIPFLQSYGHSEADTKEQVASPVEFDIVHKRRRSHRQEKLILDLLGEIHQTSDDDLAKPQTLTAKVDSREPTLNTPRVENTEDDFALITGGFSEASKSVLHLGLFSGRNHCQTQVQLPFPLSHHAALMTIEKALILCGGLTSQGEISSKCIKYDTKRGDWQTFPTLPLPLAHVSSQVMPDGKMFIFGGGQVITFSDSDFKWKMARKYDQPSFSACSTKWDEQSIIITGGQTPSGEALKTAMIFDTESLTFASLPELNIARSQHGCSMVTSPKFNGMFVAGGVNSVLSDLVASSVEYIADGQ